MPSAPPEKFHVAKPNPDASLYMVKEALTASLSMMNFVAAVLTGERPSRELSQGRSVDELLHFEVCPMCGQAVDRRDDLSVMHHLPLGHAPMPRH